MILLINGDRNPFCQQYFRQSFISLFLKTEFKVIFKFGTIPLIYDSQVCKLVQDLLAYKVGKLRQGVGGRG